LVLKNIFGKKPMLAIIGNAGDISEDLIKLAADVGRIAVDAGFRVICGGLDGVMEAACNGAKHSTKYTEGDIIGILPGYDRKVANDFLDIIIPTGLELGRNIILVASSDVIISIGGKAGTLSEIALAWQLKKPIIALEPSGGWSGKLAGTALDDRRDDTIITAKDPDEAIRLAIEIVKEGRPEPGIVGKKWRVGKA